MHSQGKCEVSLWLRAQINGFLDQRLLVVREDSQVEQMTRRGSGAKSNEFLVALGYVTDGILGFHMHSPGECTVALLLRAQINGLLDQCVFGLRQGSRSWYWGRPDHW